VELKIACAVAAIANLAARDGLTEALWTRLRVESKIANDKEMISYRGFLIAFGICSSRLSILLIDEAAYLSEVKGSRSQKGCFAFRNTTISI
jgi:hypothetical protein